MMITTTPTIKPPILTDIRFAKEDVTKIDDVILKIVKEWQERKRYG